MRTQFFLTKTLADPKSPMEVNIGEMQLAISKTPQDYLQVLGPQSSKEFTFFLRSVLTGYLKFNFQKI